MNEFPEIFNQIFKNTQSDLKEIAIQEYIDGKITKSQLDEKMKKLQK